MANFQMKDKQVQVWTMYKLKVNRSGYNLISGTNFLCLWIRSVFPSSGLLLTICKMVYKNSLLVSVTQFN